MQRTAVFALLLTLAFQQHTLPTSVPDPHGNARNQKPSPFFVSHFSAVKNELQSRSQGHCIQRAQWNAKGRYGNRRDKETPQHRIGRWSMIEVADSGGRNTPKLLDFCERVANGGCSDPDCNFDHGNRLFDANRGVWRRRPRLRGSVGEAGRGDVRGTKPESANTLPTAVSGKEDADHTRRRRWEESGFRGRGACERCNRAKRVCLCDSLPLSLIDIQTRLIVLQHPKERKKQAYGTVPLLPLCISNVTVIHGQFPRGSLGRGPKHTLDGMFEGNEVLEAALAQPTTALLFPDLDPHDALFASHPELRSSRAVYLEELYEHATVGGGTAQPVGRPSGGVPGAKSGGAEDTASELRIQTLVAIDGTWAQAKNIFRFTPSLHRARRVCFASGVEGEYTFRREPQHNFLSTLESLAHSLPLIEPDPATGQAAREALLRAFRRMVQRQLQCTAAGAAEDATEDAAATGASQEIVPS